MWCLLFWPEVCMADTSWAAWIQALGAVAAIGGAFAVGHRQTRTAIAHDRRKASNQLDGFARLFSVTKGEIQMLASEDEVFRRAGGDFETSQLRKVQRLQRAIDRIALEQLPGEVAMDSVLAIQTALADLMPRVDGSDPDSNNLAAIRECVEAIQEDIGQMRLEAARVLHSGPSHSAAA